MFEKEATNPEAKSEGTQGRQVSAGFQQTRVATKEGAACYVDGQPIQGLPQPTATVRQILSAAGKDPEGVQAFRLANANDSVGRQVPLDERIEVSSSNPCYFRTEALGEQERSLGITDIKSGAPGGSKPTVPGPTPTNPPSGGPPRSGPAQ